MAKIVRGKRDGIVKAILAALEAYEAQFAGSDAALYRQNPGSVHIRIIDDRFAGMSKSRRHAAVWKFLAQHLDEDLMSEISVLLLFLTAELRTSLANMEFEDPTPSYP